PEAAECGGRRRRHHTRTRAFQSVVRRPAGFQQVYADPWGFGLVIGVKKGQHLLHIPSDLLRRCRKEAVHPGDQQYATRAGNEIAAQIVMMRERARLGKDIWDTMFTLVHICQRAGTAADSKYRLYVGHPLISQYLLEYPNDSLRRGEIVSR